VSQVDRVAFQALHCSIAVIILAISAHTIASVAHSWASVPLTIHIIVVLVLSLILRLYLVLLTFGGVN